MTTTRDTIEQPILDEPPSTDHNDRFEQSDDLDDESWLATTQPKGVRVRVPFALLGVGIAVALGMFGGAKLEANQNPATTASAFTRAAGAARTGSAATGTAPTGAARGGLTGTVASVQGQQIQLTTSTGSTVTITLLPSTAIAKTGVAAPSDITAGETITVRGQTGTDGNTTAQAVTIVPATSAGG